METEPRFWIVIFQNIFTLWHITINIYIWKTKFSSHKHYLFGPRFSRNAKNIHRDQSILPTSLLCPKRNISRTLKSSSCKKSLPSVYIMDATCFDECFLFRVITGRHSFLHKLIVTQRFDVTAMLLRSLKQVFWKKSIFHIH